MLMLFFLACSSAEDPAASDLPTPPPPEPDPVVDTAVLDTGEPDPLGGDDPLPDPCSDDGFEDNDDLDSAVPWTDAPLAVMGDDPDFFSFELQPGESRRVELYFDHTYGNIDLTVYNELYLPVATSYSFSDDEVALVTNTSGVPTTARIRVLLRDPGCNDYTVDVIPVGSGGG